MNNTEALPTATPAQTRRTILRLLRPHCTSAILTVVVLLAGAGCGLAGPWLLGRIVDLVVEHQDRTALAVTAGLLVVSALGQAVFTSAGNALLARLGQTVIGGIRERVVARALQTPAERIERSGTGDLLARVSGDVESVNDALSSTFPVLIDATLTIGLTIVGLILLDWRFAVAAAFAVPFQAVALRWYLRTVVPFSRWERIAEGVRAQRLLDAIDGAATVQALGLAGRHTTMVAEASAEAKRFSIRMAILQRRFFGRLNYGEFFGLAAVLIAGFWLVDSGTVTIGTAAAAALYFVRLFDPFNASLGTFDDAQYAGASLARLVGVITAPEPVAAEPIEPEDGSVRLRNVSYEYEPGHPVLRGISLDIAEGEQVAVVGATGAGKSTLVKLIAGIHEPSEGEILLGGVPVSHCPAHHSVLITQEVHTFAGSLLADLRLANEDADEQEVLAALEKVGAKNWVHALAHGVNTVVGSGGHRLLATQAQQVALARLTLANPVLAILDEATAEAGSAGARTLEQAAAASCQGRTALIVAHRLTQAAAADRIVVLDSGAIAEEGTHVELLAAGGIYAALWSAWSDARAPVS